MPRLEKGSAEAKEYMAMLRSRKRNAKPSSPVVEPPKRGRPKKASGILDQLTKAGTKAGQPFDTAIGLNPFTLGMSLGEDVIAPELMKIIPPKKR
jgi:hypothetical protein